MTAIITHAELVKAGASWLRRKQKCKAVLIECSSWSWPEIPDAIGFRPDGESFLVEAKTTLADLYAQLRKPSFRERGMGRTRWFLTPLGLVPHKRYVEEPFVHWGLLEAKRSGVGFRIVERVASRQRNEHEWNGQAEAALLTAELARLSIVAGQAPGRRNGMQGLSVKPVELPLACPWCSTWHVDDGGCAPSYVYADEARRKYAHRAHTCKSCGNRWTPTELFPTVGVMPAAESMPKAEAANG